MELQAIQYPQKVLPADAAKVSNKNSSDASKKPFWGDDGFTFADVIDMLNPLQHLPVVSKYYREISGDDCSEGSKLIGDLGFASFFGGALGLAGVTANTALRHNTDQDVSEHLMDFASHSFHSPDTSEKHNVTQNNVDSDTIENSFFARTVEGANEYILTAKESNIAKIQNKKVANINPFFAELFQYDADENALNPRDAVKHSGRDWGTV